MARVWPLFTMLCMVVTLAIRVNSETETMKVTDNLKEGTTSKRCYTCSANEPNSDCELHPENLRPSLGLLECPRDLCTIVRVEAFPSFEVTSFYRGCDKKVAMFDSGQRCESDANSRTCFTSCTTDKCNNGDGRVLDKGSLQYARPPFMDPKNQALRFVENPILMATLATCSLLYNVKKRFW